VLKYSGIIIRKIVLIVNRQIKIARVSLTIVRTLAIFICIKEYILIIIP